MVTPSNHDRYLLQDDWDEWLRHQRLPPAAFLEFDPKEVSWRHPELPGYFSLPVLVNRQTLGNTEPYIGWGQNRNFGFESTACIVSSRVGRQLDRLPTWVRALRTAAIRILQDRRTLLTAEDTTTGQSTEYLAQVLALKRIAIRNFGKGLNWFRAQIRTECPGAGTFFLGRLTNRPSEFALANPLDHFLVNLSERVYVLSVRGNNNMARALQHRFETRGNLHDVWILHDRRLTNKSLLQKYADWGAIPWLISEKSSESNDTSENRFVEFSPSTGTDDENFLLHCTRGRAADFRKPELDQLFFGESSRVAGALGTLLEILISGRILAHGKLVRGGRPVICWTANPLSRLSELRVYRRHLARWDFEPFGFAVRRSVLARWGARPVQYGTLDQRNRLPVEEQAFFQVTSSRIGDTEVDWMAEREWRLLDDLELSKLGSDDAFLFVPDRESANFLAPFSRWPIRILSQ